MDPYLISQARRIFLQNTRSTLPIAWLFTDLERLPNPMAVIAGLPPDIGVVIRDYRHKYRYSYAAELVDLCQTHHRPVLIGGDAALALELNANGVHWPQWANIPSGLNMFQSFSVHNHMALHRAKAHGADAVFISPVFKTRSHQNAPALGPAGLRRFTRHSSIAAYAMGGIDRKNLHLLRSLPLAGFAGIGCFI